MRWRACASPRLWYRLLWHCAAPPAAQGWRRQPPAAMPRLHHPPPPPALLDAWASPIHSHGAGTQGVHVHLPPLQKVERWLLHALCEVSKDGKVSAGTGALAQLPCPSGACSAVMFSFPPRSQHPLHARYKVRCEVCCPRRRLLSFLFPSTCLLAGDASVPAALRLPRIVLHPTCHTLPSACGRRSSACKKFAAHAHARPPVAFWKLEA